MLEVKKVKNTKNEEVKSMFKKEDVRGTSSCWMVLLLMVEDEVHRVWTMLLLIGVSRGL